MRERANLVGLSRVADATHVEGDVGPDVLVPLRV